MGTPTEENAQRVMRVLRCFGAALGDLTVDDPAREDTVFEMGVPPRRIDILTSIDGVRFEEAWGRRVDARMDGIPVAVLGRDDLITNKRAADRPKDRLDVRSLERFGPKTTTSSPRKKGKRTPQT